MAENDGLVRPEERADTRFAWAMAGLAAGVGALPLLLPTGLAPQDWPSHLARAAMLADMLRGDGPWAAFYTLNPSAWANVLVDALAVALLSAKVPFLIAARVVLVLCYLAFLGGFNALARVTAGGGAIINLGGMSAHFGTTDRAHVVAAKTGVVGLTRALAHDLAPFHITANCVVPGLIDTKRGKSGHGSASLAAARMPLAGRLGRPEEVASMVRTLVGPQSRYITGQTIHVNGGAFLI